jgi:hypothetical protein
MSLPQKAARPASFAALVDSESRTRILAGTVTALRERRIDQAQAGELNRCVADFAKLANVQLEYARALGERRPVHAGPLPLLAAVLRRLERQLVAEALQESARLRAELAPILADARRRLHAARR